MFGRNFRIPFFILGALCAGLVFTAGALAQEPERPEMAGDPYKGGDIYRQRGCMECHGRDGRGVVAGTPDLNEKVRWNDTDLLNHILRGFQVPGVEAPTPGPSLEDLTVTDLRNVLAFLHDYFHYKSFAKTGEQIYMQTCVACHGEDGKGAPGIPGVPDFTQAEGRLSQSHEVLLKHILEGFQSSGSAMAMPPKGGMENLMVQDMREVLAYLHQEFHWHTYE